MTKLDKIRRIREIGKIVAKHRLAAYFPKSLLNLFRVESSGNNDTQNFRIEEEIRLAFEELGTTFIKLGQLMSLRSDIIPESLANELKKLTDDVKPIGFDLIRPIIEQELSAPVDEIFEDFDETPVASASISQVYSAKLRADSSDVVIKVRKPGIVETIRTDTEIILWIAEGLKRSPYGENFDFKGIAEEFFWSMNTELNLLIEMSNTNKLRENFRGEEWSWITFPKMYEEYCTEQMLVMERISGKKLDGVIGAGPAGGFDCRLIAERGAEMLMQMILVDGFFHADLHPGNLFFQQGGRIVVIDCGLCGKLDRYLRESIADILISFAAKDWDRVARIYLELSGNTGIQNRELFVKELTRLFRTLPDNISEIDSNRLYRELAALFFKYRLHVPRELTLLLRSFTLLEGLCRRLSPDFKLLTVAESLAKKVLIQRMTPERIAGDSFTIMIKFLDFLQNFPVTVNDITTKLEAGEIRHQLLHFLSEGERKFTSRLVTRISSSLLMSASTLAFCLTENKNATLASEIVFGLSLLLFSSSFFRK
ncbi:AarF/ABC1/UbiB kinase family protein [bacterium]|nr:AarF/ABC1/UbiB kinase family protein [bacterium]